MKKLIRKILREEIDKSDRHYHILDKISDHVEIPYFKSMEGLTIYDKDDQEYIMRKILGNITIKEDTIYNEYGEGIYEEDQDEDEWVKWEYDVKGNLLSQECSYGNWEKREYDDKGNLIYVYDSFGNWVKYKYDDHCNVIHSVDSDGNITDRR